ncbi:50S ribosomal protein L16 3-hydroxylase [BD1-7 clade bacterium]|nr:50S ribosomal protein L16 3-hydroxylase [BD1-7 clade bacterium]
MTLLFPKNLDDLLYPVGQETFFTDYYGIKPLHIDAINTQCKAAGIGIEELLDFCECYPAKKGKRYNLCKQGKKIPESVIKAISQSGTRQWLRTHIQQQWSLIFNDVCTSYYPMHLLMYELADTLSSKAWVNAYYSPASANCLSLHSDDHDVIVWQTHGKKRWKVYSPEPKSLALLDIELSEGQMLYIPESFPHYAESSADASSLHFTIGFFSNASKNQELRNKMMPVTVQSEIDGHHIAQTLPTISPESYFSKVSAIEDVVQEQNRIIVRINRQILPFKKSYRTSIEQIMDSTEVFSCLSLSPYVDDGVDRLALIKCLFAAGHLKYEATS